MPEHPAELPAENEGGGGFRPPSPGGIGGPNELPAFNLAKKYQFSQLVNEIFRLRNRIHALESNIFAVKISSGIRPGHWPQELEESEGSGGGTLFPPEIHEIDELPISRVVEQLSSLVVRFEQFEKQVSQQLGQITKRLDTMKR